LKTRVFKKGIANTVFSGIRPVIFTFLVIAILFVGFKNAADASRARGARALEEAIVRAAVTGYAVNGYFPESIDYIVKNFGIYIDNSSFIVHYDVFASNLLPDIRVIQRGRANV